MILGIDFGASKIASGVVAGDGTVLEKKVELVDRNSESGYVLKKIIKLSRSFIDKYSSEISAIGIGAPGPLDIKRGLIVATPNLPKWKNVPIKETFEKAFGLPVFFGNDANAAALGEWKFGAGKGTTNMIYLTISTGIGGGIIVNNQLYRGRGNAGELGAMIIDMRSKAGSGFDLCGNLEFLASGTAIANKAGVVSKEVFKMANQGDKAAGKIIKAALTALGIGLLNCIHIFDPEVIVLGGGVVIHNQEVFVFLRNFVEKRVMPGFGGVMILPAGLGSDAGVVGAAALALGGLQ